MKRSEHSIGNWLLLAICALLFWTVLFLVGRWFLDLSSVRPGPLLAPSPSVRFLQGLGLILYNPISLFPVSLFLAASGILALRVRRSSSAAITFLGFAFLILGAFWVPNPIVLWPVSVLGEHSLPELIDELFTFQLVPAPELSYDSSAGFDALIRWQLMEAAARLFLLLLAWASCLFAIWKMDRKWGLHSGLPHCPPV